MRLILVLILIASLGRIVWQPDRPLLDLRLFNLFRLEDLSSVAKPKLKDTWEYAPAKKERLITVYVSHAQLKGDFDGDGNAEILYESLMSRKTGRFIDSISYIGYYTSYDQVMDAFCELDPVMKLKTNTGMNDLKIKSDCYNMGIRAWQNLGNINTTPGDEFALVTGRGDDYDRNVCKIYSYCTGSWEKVFEYKIDEEDLFDAESSTDKLSNILKKRNGEWKWLEGWHVDGGPKWEELESCDCTVSN